MNSRMENLISVPIGLLRHCHVLGCSALRHTAYVVL
jgi:hypothetical protein